MSVVLIFSQTCHIEGELASQLNAAGHTSVSVANMLDVPLRLYDANPDVLLVAPDVELSDGLRLAASLRDSAEWCRLPVVLLDEKTATHTRVTDRAQILPGRWSCAKVLEHVWLTDKVR